VVLWYGSHRENGCEGVCVCVFWLERQLGAGAGAAQMGLRKVLCVDDGARGETGPEEEGGVGSCLGSRGGTRGGVRGRV